MEKPILPHWRLQQIVRFEVERLAPNLPIVPVVMHDDKQIAWDEECPGLGHAPWKCKYFIPPGNAARAIVHLLNEAIAQWQARYDLGVTS
ncbi:MAG: hypothetical protein ACK4UO_07815 [Pseudolabrys sp.]